MSLLVYIEKGRLVAEELDGPLTKKVKAVVKEFAVPLVVPKTRKPRKKSARKTTRRKPSKSVSVKEPKRKRGRPRGKK